MNIRQATAADLTTIHKLVEELAIYEKEPDAFVATIEDYHRDFESGWFEAILAEDGAGQVLGMAVYYETFSTWNGRMLYLEDFVVTEASRKTGIGQLLFEQVLQIAKEKECKLLKWQVLDWNEPALNFYRKNRATIEDNWLNGKIYL
ncbi:MAG: GNAT family N-acetyltransferase [Bacteroidota bacterium]